MPIILDGKKLNMELGEILKEKILKLEEKPKLVIVQIGDLEASNKRQDEVNRSIRETLGDLKEQLKSARK